jgi:hypothetical protein
MPTASRLRSSLPWRPACPKTKLAISSPTGEKSDVVHDLLAYLAERMLEMNKQKRQRSGASWAGWRAT